MGAPGQRWRGGALHLAALWGLAVVQPTLELLSDGDNAAIFFAGRRVIGLTFVAVVVVAAVLPLLLLIALEALAARFGKRYRERLHVFLFWVLSALFALYALARIWRSLAEDPNGSLAIIAGAAALGAGFTLLYRRWEPLSSVLSVLAVVPLVSLALFVFASPASELAFAGADSHAVKAPASATPVVLLILDELPVSTLMDKRERIDAERFPGFGALARDATWYRGEVSSADDTVQALPSILASTTPERGDQPVHSANARTIFQLLGDSHRVQAMEHATWLCPPDICPNSQSTLTRSKGVASALSLAYFDTIVPSGLFSKLGVGMPDIGRSWGEALRPERPTRPVAETLERTKNQPRELNRYADSQFAQFLRTIGPYRDGERPAPFYMLHSALPHIPWVYLPDGRTYASIRERFPAGLTGNETWVDSPALVQLAWQRHILQARFADRAVGALLDKLKRRGLYDRALVVVTADHGASFDPGGNRRFVTRANAADVSMVPLLVKAPGQREATVEDRALQSIDLLPTMAELLRRRLPWRADGRPAAASRGSVTISSFKNPELKTTPARLVRQRSRTVRAQTELFGSGLDGGGGYGLGPFRGLVGRRVSQIPRAPGSGQARLSRQSSVDPASRYLPAARVFGSISGARPAVATVAVAVNGRVVGVGPTVPTAGRRGFSLVVDPRHYRKGTNDVRAYAVRGSSRRPRLGPLS